MYRDALDQARRAKDDESINRRSKKGRRIDHGGFRRVAAYLTPTEFRELEKLAEGSGDSLSVALRACVRTVKS